jgi:hypothetical protein
MIKTIGRKHPAACHDKGLASRAELPEVHRIKPLPTFPRFVNSSAVT